MPAAIDVNLTNEQVCVTHPIIAVSRRLFFAAPDSAHGLELWTSDGTSSGTRIVADLNPGTPSSYPTSFGILGTTLYFDPYDGVHGRELWAYSLAEPQRRRPVRTAALTTSDSRSTVSTRPTARPTPGTARAR
jgi:ELWxxDGT repeat protein